MARLTTGAIIFYLPIDHVESFRHIADVETGSENPRMSNPADERYPPLDVEYTRPDGSTVIETIIHKLDHRDYLRKHNAVSERNAPHPSKR